MLDLRRREFPDQVDQYRGAAVCADRILRADEVIE